MRDEPRITPSTVCLLVGMASLAVGCSAAAPGQVQELEPGTYSIGINRTSSYLAESDKAIGNAVNKAGEHCHAKGQKFVLKSAVGKTVVFRCVPMNPGEPAPAPASAQAPQPLPPPPQPLPPLPQQ